MKPIQNIQNIRFVFRTILCSLTMIVTLNMVNQAFAHGDHKRYSGRIIDPLITHHSILEDEQRLNLFYFNNQHLNGQTGHGVGMSLELSYSLNDAFGVEAFIPFYSADVSGRTRRDLGDIEVQPLKLSFYRSMNLVITGVMAFVLPTGNEGKGFGSGNTSAEPHLFVDAVLGKFAVQANLVYGRTITGDSESEIEYNLAVSRSIFKEKQTWSALVEFNGGVGLTGEEDGESTLYVTPGLKYAAHGWHIGVGVQLPVTDNRSADWIGLVQGGFHFNL